MPLAIPVSESSYFQICAAVRWLCEPDRGPFLKAIVDELDGHEIGDGVVARAVGRAFKAFYRPPADDTGLRASCCARSAMDGRMSRTGPPRSSRPAASAPQLHFLRPQRVYNRPPADLRTATRARWRALGVAISGLRVCLDRIAVACSAVGAWCRCLDCLMQMCGRPDQQIAVCKTSEQHLAVSGRLKRVAKHGQDNGYFLKHSKFSCSINNDSRRVSGHPGSSACARSGDCCDDRQNSDTVTC